ncbi:hypothetical protein AOXY_G3077 [Acipenser oxyrinchus oxyrinchus]|uniref:Ankyrin repeat protein n=1 Tax=Acipenser oxyrinchus oxyrinchus TaxID=40147 RepID=A0AAD8LQ55_ACIOX|nr:hypothetical protein AOXY_G3077 [Acipenser oxyrinchus oxyrinchus]
MGFSSSELNCTWLEGGKVILEDVWMRIPFPIRAFLRRLDNSVTPQYVGNLISGRTFSFEDGFGVEFCGSEYFYGSVEPGSNEMQFYAAHGEMAVKVNKNIFMSFLKIILDSRPPPLPKNIQECYEELKQNIRQLEKYETTVQQAFKAARENDCRTLLSILSTHFSDSEDGSEDMRVDSFVRDSSGFTLLHRAAWSNRPAVIDVLWQLTDSWEDFTTSPAWLPLWLSDMVQLKPVDSETTAHITGKSALELAEEMNNRAAADAIRAIDKCQRSLLPIHFAARLGDTEWVKNIAFNSISARSTVNMTTEGKGCPLWMACTRGHLETVKLLIGLGADPGTTSQDGKGQTLLHRAVSFGNEDVARYLIESHLLGVDVRDRYGCTPLYYSLQLGLPRICFLLLKCGANLDAQCVNPLTLCTDSPRLLLERKEFQHLRQLLVCSVTETDIDNVCADLELDVAFLEMSDRPMMSPTKLLRRLRGPSDVTSGRPQDTSLQYYYNLYV